MLKFRNAGLKDEVKPAAKKATKRPPAPRPYCLALRGPTGASLGYITEIEVVRMRGGVPEPYSTALARQAAEKAAHQKSKKG